MEIDPVILQLRADVDRYVSTLNSTTTKVNQLLGKQEASARKLEKQMLRSSTAISGSLKRLAGTLATYFTGRELVGLLDSFTRYQNQLKTAGYEGERLAEVQSRLSEVANKYGVSLESVGTLFGRNSASAKELNLSFEQQLRIVEATSAALKVSGSSSAEASGALLQLSQALGGTTIQATEYNSLIDGARPLLQAVADGSDRWGGSITKLTADVKDSNVSVREFVDALLSGSGGVIKQAENSTLTLAGAFQTLQNKLTEYVGQAAAANGVTETLSGAIVFLAEHLDTLISAIAVIATAMGVRYVVAAGAATISTIAASNAIFAMQARMAGAATTTEALAFAMGGLKGSLATVAILALGAAIYYVATREQTAADGALRYQKAVDAANKRRSEATELAYKLASATDKEREATEKSIAVALKKARADQIAAVSAVKRAQAELAVARATAARLNRTAASSGLRGQAEIGTVQAEANRNLRLRTGELQGLTESLEILNEAVAILRDPLSIGALPSIEGGGDGKDGKKKKGQSGPTAAEIEQRFNSELASISQQTLSAKSSVAASAEEKAELELRSVELARLHTRAEIENDKDYTATQKKRLLTAVEVLAHEERAAIEFQKQRQLEQEAADLAEEQYRAKRDDLQIQYDLAETQADRKRIALEIVRAEYEEQKGVLQRIIDSKTLDKAIKQRAQIALDSLNALHEGEVKRTARQNETPRERYLRELNELRTSSGKVNEAIDEIRIDGLDALNDGLVEAIMGTKSLGKVFKEVANQIIADLLRIAIRRAIIAPLANAVFGAAGNAFGGGGNSWDVEIGGGIVEGERFGIDSIWPNRYPVPRASGGPVSAGQTYLIGENGPELLRMGSQSGAVIPNHLLNTPAAMPRGASGGVVQIQVVEGQMFEPRVRVISGDVSVQTVRGAAPALIEASARETIARTRRPTL